MRSAEAIQNRVHRIGKVHVAVTRSGGVTVAGAYANGEWAIKANRSSKLAIRIAIRMLRDKLQQPNVWRVNDWVQ